ncbi:HSP20-like chaperone [Paraphaeosphaeria sporulosa]|uniref:HSP20-like chaperone n=1 Tax=Paraphaeosphaeria sporulosa TaxID=1460663 RepID=A0A177CL23_9PLEO|nr:HSP20-like chaperone [Paraphaeosphaeria sporulosa]OAG07568.1 HSP20-like chaperone [Paraphaeosphaeria sporulosa]
MAFFLTPQFAPAYTAPQCNPWACAPRPQQSYRRVVRPSFPSFAPFLSEVDEIITALDQEARREAARREAHRQRQQRKRIVRAHFNVHEHQGGYQVDAEIPGFEQEHIEIEVTDDNTLRLSGNTERKAEPQPQSQSTETATETLAIETEPHNEVMDGVTLNEPEQATASGAATPTHSDTESHKSYQATVEDDFEDLGAETSSTISAHTDSEAPKESKGKEKAVEEPATANTETAVQQQPQPEEPAEKQQREEWQFHGSFERTFRFPERIDAANVTASLRNGLLSINVPKAKAPEVRRILIQ